VHFEKKEKLFDTTQQIENPFSTKPRIEIKEFKYVFKIINVLSVLDGCFFCFLGLHSH